MSKHPTVLENIYDYLILNTKSKRSNHVITINNLNKEVYYLNLYRPLLKFIEIKHKLFFLIVIVIIALLDSDNYTIVLKIWLFLVFLITYLILNDQYLTSSIRYTHPLSKKISKFKYYTWNNHHNNALTSSSSIATTTTSSINVNNNHN